ncbi:hypothetical protein, variant [Saprolegnia diclina VS20]|uniref:Arf-GAP domain-containing protein n=1 Tax=Saprolegnia diclina (strain VS20) TaxID=1156394 RepID=T0QZ44_SAPDV|nr:hypothetical protein, variant [Saprolegnia diclina VS20]EQC39951.1 hypothetical protein, variant [Saprolegnia diclina VS20]|eukprot:XP_008606425.1 hypothetical protein, variant [Saprolegnia diclina VS20]
MSKNGQRVADLVRGSPENMACADCGVTLTTASDATWAALTFGAFVCLQCAGAHRQLGVNISRVKSVHMDSWTDDEVKRMLGNRAVNAVYEKHLRPDAKATTRRALQCNAMSRDDFVRLKYEARTFTTDAGRAFQGPTSEKTERRGATTSGSIVEVSKRFVNYFVVVGRGQAVLGKPLGENASPSDVQFVPTILDSFPDAHADAPLPSHISQFAFPEGLALSPTHITPTFFTFVLTNVSGAKLYACALKFVEELSPLEVLTLFAPPPGSEKSKAPVIPKWAQDLSSGSASTTSVYCPKCLLLISHHPLFSSYRLFLQQIYRLSLSTAPMPIERYIANFVSEVPMPPRGRIQVQLTLPERTIYIARPPKNQLPLADFSLRSLFQVLDMNNVLTVVACLLLEQKVALCSKHLALLTPIAETLLTLLFPLAWQGAYIPVLPSSLLDVIDAPVPFLVGVHSKYLATASRSTDVFFIDLDHNRIIPPRNEDGIETVLPKMPERAATKLKVKLQNCANVFDPFAPEIAKADWAFGGDEYLEPITDFASSGMTLPMPSAPSDVVASRKGSLGDKRTLSAVSAASLTASSSLSQYSSLHFSSFKLLSHTSSSASMLERDRSLSSSGADGLVLPPTPSPGAGFVPDQVRQSFLRFFISMLKRYASYLNNDSSKTNTAPIFDAAGFLRDNSDAASRPFLSVMIESQMFQRFCEDRLFNPTLPEVVFFDQAINQKLNRSLSLGKKKHDVSFLEDKTDVIRETFVAPSPSTLGLPDNGAVYHYKAFPRLKKHLFGTIRKPRELYAAREQQRFVAPVDVHQQIYRLSTCVKDTAATWDATRRLVTRLQAFYRSYRQRSAYLRMRRAVLCIQRHLAARLKRQQLQASYRRLRAAITCLQGRFRMVAQRAAYQRQRQALLRLQAFGKQVVYTRRLQRLRHGILRLQARFRGQQQARVFGRIRADVVRLQSVFRGVLTRMASLQWRQELLSTYRDTIFELWQKACVPLLYRSKFWIIYDKPDFLSLGVHLEEMGRLHAILTAIDGHERLHPTVVPTGPVAKTLKTLWTPVLRVHRRAARARRQHLLKSSHSSFDIAFVRLEEEMLELYEQLKYHTTDALLHAFYADFDICSTSKLKKRSVRRHLTPSAGVSMVHLARSTALDITDDRDAQCQRGAYDRQWRRRARTRRHQRDRDQAPLAHLHGPCVHGERGHGVASEDDATAHGQGATRGPGPHARDGVPEPPLGDSVGRVPARVAPLPAAPRGGSQ